MPTYEYRCDQCGFEFEEFQSMKDEPIEKCPKCGGKVQRLIGAGSGMIFKGSGFYLTDYKKSNSSPSEVKGEKKQVKKEEPKSKAEDKTEAKAEKPVKK